MQQLGFFLLVFCILAPLSSSLIYPGIYGKLEGDDQQKRFPRSVSHKMHSAMRKPSHKKSWIGEYGENVDYSKMSNEDVSYMMMMKMRMKMKKMLQPLRYLFIKVLDLGPKPAVAGRPEFCGTRDCPSYTVLSKKDHCELRNYPAARWVSTSMQGNIVSRVAISHCACLMNNLGSGKLDKPEDPEFGKMNAKVVSICFWRLFKYIQGKNSLRKKIKMTTPVITQIKSDPTSGLKNLTMSFYLPPALTTPPTPVDNQVFLETKSFKVYTHDFSEYAIREKTWKKHALMMHKMLAKDSLTEKYYPFNEMYITASYNDPMKLFNTRNEVWFIVKEKQKQGMDEQ